MISDSDRVRRSDHISAASIGVTAMTKSRVVKMTGGIADMVPPYAIGDCGAVLDCTSSNRLMRARMSRRGAATEDWPRSRAVRPGFSVQGVPSNGRRTVPTRGPRNRIAAESARLSEVSRGETMETRTVDVVLQHPDGRMVARLTVRYPPPAAIGYAGRQWHRAAGFGPDDAVYRPDQPW